MASHPLFLPAMLKMTSSTGGESFSPSSPPAEDADRSFRAQVAFVRSSRKMGSETVSDVINGEAFPSSASLESFAKSSVSSKIARRLSRQMSAIFGRAKTG